VSNYIIKLLMLMWIL